MTTHWERREKKGKLKCFVLFQRPPINFLSLDTHFQSLRTSVLQVFVGFPQLLGSYTYIRFGVIYYQGGTQVYCTVYLSPRTGNCVPPLLEITGGAVECLTGARTVWSGFELPIVFTYITYIDHWFSALILRIQIPAFFCLFSWMSGECNYFTRRIENQLHSGP